MNQTILTAIIQQDHTDLRAEIAAFGSVKRVLDTTAWEVLQTSCARVSKILLGHIKREKKYVISSGHALGADLLKKNVQTPADHYGDYRYLQVITRCVVLENRPFLLNSRYHMLVNFFKDLEKHMDRQEEVWGISPMKDQALAPISRTQ